MATWMSAAAAVAWLFGGIACSHAASVGPIRTQSGAVTGVQSRWFPSVTVFKGIPYAAPPVGRLRFRAPQPPAPWRGVRRADHFGDICPQPAGVLTAGQAMGENCLFLNIWTGSAASAAKRPVFVWIYGGAFTFGSGSDPAFNGAGLARKGLVVVTFNYRLGPLGFLATPALSRESGHAASGDYGLLDMIAALRWVRGNIAAFGGDPRNVTIAGQSAGGGAVGFLDMSPLARGLFQRAISESHQRDPRDPELRYLSTSYRTLHDAERQGLAYARAHGASTLGQLRAIPWQRLVKGDVANDMSVHTGSPARPPLFRPVVDGWVLPENYSRTYAAGLQDDVPYISGNNRDESGAVPDTAFARLRAQTRKPEPGNPEPVVTLGQYRKAAQRKFGAMTQEFLGLYPAYTDQGAARENDTRVRDNSRISLFLWAALRARHMKEPIYTYFWAHAPPGPGHDMRGAYHGSEINYVFDNLYDTPRPWTAEDRRIADIMSSYWANFAATGNPNGKGLPHWPAFNPTQPVVMELGDHFGPIPIASSKARLAFWQRYFTTQTPW
jgi:para-nitrobenzyl esterase